MDFCLTPFVCGLLWPLPDSEESAHPIQRMTLQTARRVSWVCCATNRWIKSLSTRGSLTISNLCRQNTLAAPPAFARRHVRPATSSQVPHATSLPKQPPARSRSVAKCSACTRREAEPVLGGQTAASACATLIRSQEVDLAETGLSQPLGSRRSLSHGASLGFRQTCGPELRPDAAARR